MERAREKEGFFKELETGKKLLLTTRNKQREFPVHIMRKKA